MQRNFILTDVMKTGFHGDLEDFISLHTLPNQQFDMTGEYYTLHHYDLDSYDRRFAVIDYRQANDEVDGAEFNAELDRRCKLLHSQGFVFIKACPWESRDNLKEVEVKSGLFPKYDIDHIMWTGGVSWFWFYMYRKHLNHKLSFDHSEKKYDFLYLNKAARPHRVKMLEKMPQAVLDKSLWTDWPKRKLDKQYELPWAQDYPRWGMDQDVYELPFNHTKYNFVSESNDVNDEIFMTEKIWKPIIAQQPFVVHGNHLYLQKLREMGFQTFGEYFSEKYDITKDPDERIEKIAILCEKMQKINWKDFYLHSQALRKHNYRTFFNKWKLSKQINETIDLFLEFADSR